MKVYSIKISKKLKKKFNLKSFKELDKNNLYNEKVLYVVFVKLEKKLDKIFRQIQKFIIYYLTYN